MSYRARLCLRIGALVSSLSLLTGFVAFRAGLLPSETAVTHDPSDVSLDLNAIGTLRNPSSRPTAPSPSNVTHNLNSMGTEFSQSNTQWSPAALPKNDQPLLLDVGIHDAGMLFSGEGGDRLESQGIVLAAGADDSFVRERTVTHEAIEELRRQPGRASPVLIHHDAMTLMAGSKSMVVLPTTPVEIQKVVARFQSGAAQFFTRHDRNRDGKLTQDELSDDEWRKLRAEGAVQNDAVDSDGIVKNYVWLSRQK